MTVRIGLGVVIGLLSGISIAAGQAVPSANPSAYPPVQAAYPAQPDQPVMPQNPTIQAATPQMPQIPAPFTLTPPEEAKLDQALKIWEEGTKNVSNFQCTFKRLEYNLTMAGADPTKPSRTDSGEMRYGAPDKGLFQVSGTQPEKWICDGRSIFEYDYPNKRLTEHRLPKALAGKAITDGPLPFLFGSSAEKLKKRYYLREITPPASVGKEIWIQAWPRFQTDAANFSCAELIVRMSDKMPTALRMYSPNKIDNTVYVFDDQKINDLLHFITGDPFRPATGLGWTKVVDDLSAPQPQPGPQEANRQQAQAPRK